MSIPNFFVLYPITKNEHLKNLNSRSQVKKLNFFIFQYFFKILFSCDWKCRPDHGDAFSFHVRLTVLELIRDFHNGWKSLLLLLCFFLLLLLFFFLFPQSLLTSYLTNEYNFNDQKWTCYGQPRAHGTISFQRS